MVQVNPQPNFNGSLADLIGLNEEEYLQLADECKDLAFKVTRFLEKQRERNYLLAKLSLQRFDSIPDQLEPLLDEDDLEGAADLLKAFVKTRKQVDGVLPGPVDLIYAMLREENPDVQAVRKMLVEVRKDLQKEYLASQTD